jgi:hypothetical protein
MCARRCACGVRCGVRPSRGRCWLQAPLIGPPSMLPPLSKCAHVQGSVSKCAHVQGSVREKTAELTPSPILSLCWRKMQEASGVDCPYACSSMRRRKLRCKESKSDDGKGHDGSLLERERLCHSSISAVVLFHIGGCPLSVLLLSSIVPNNISLSLSLSLSLGQGM